MKLIIDILKFSLIGFFECFLSSLNSKFRQRSKGIPTFISQFINILIWYFILRAILNGSMDWIVVIFYAMSFAGGDVTAVKFDLYLEKLAKIKGIKRRRKKRSKGGDRKK